jgi:hypothetical protein
MTTKTTFTVEISKIPASGPEPGCPFGTQSEWRGVITRVDGDVRRIVRVMSHPRKAYLVAALRNAIQTLWQTAKEGQ